MRTLRLVSAIREAITLISATEGAANVEADKVQRFAVERLGEPIVGDDRDILNEMVTVHQRAYRKGVLDEAREPRFREKTRAEEISDIHAEISLRQRHIKPQ